MPEVYLCRTFLPDNTEAIAFEIPEVWPDYPYYGSVVRFHNRESKDSTPHQEIRLDDKVDEMHFIPDVQILAVHTEKSNRIETYSLDPRHKGSNKTVNFPFSIEWFKTTSHSLIVGGQSSLYLIEYENNKNTNPLENQKPRKLVELDGDIKGLAAADHFILCEVGKTSVDPYQRTLYFKKVMLLDSQGELIRDIFSDRIYPNNSFLGILDQHTFFTAIPNKEKMGITIYNFNHEKRLNYFEIPSEELISIYALHQGHIGVCFRGADFRFRIEVYDAFDSSLLYSTTHSHELQSREDFIIFLGDKDKCKLAGMGESIVEALNTVGLFPTIGMLVRDYAISSPGLNTSQMEKLLPKLGK